MFQRCNYCHCAWTLSCQSLWYLIVWDSYFVTVLARRQKEALRGNSKQVVLRWCIKFTHTFNQSPDQWIHHSPSSPSITICSTLSKRSTHVLKNSRRSEKFLTKVSTWIQSWILDHHHFKPLIIMRRSHLWGQIVVYTRLPTLVACEKAVFYWEGQLKALEKQDKIKWMKSSRPCKNKTRSRE